MIARVLVDTSVWIAFFRGKDINLVERIAALLKSQKAVYIGIIALELINGAKGQKELQVLNTNAAPHSPSLAVRQGGVRRHRFAVRYIA